MFTFIFLCWSWFYFFENYLLTEVTDISLAKRAKRKRSSMREEKRRRKKKKRKTKTSCWFYFSYVTQEIAGFGDSYMAVLTWCPCEYVFSLIFTHLGIILREVFSTMRRRVIFSIPWLLTLAMLFLFSC